MTDQPTPPAADDEQAARWARREHLAVLVSRAARGRLLPTEGPMLRAAVDAELADAEKAHQLVVRLRQDTVGLQDLVRTLMRTERQEHDRAEQAEDLLRVAHDTSNRSEAERARAVQRAEQAEAILRDLVSLTAVTHAYRIQGGHDTLGPNLTCAGCELADRARQHLAGGV